MARGKEGRAGRYDRSSDCREVGEQARVGRRARPDTARHTLGRFVASSDVEGSALVEDTQVGTRHIYRIDPRDVGAMRDWLDAAWTRALNDLGDFADVMNEEEKPE